MIRVLLDNKGTRAIVTLAPGPITIGRDNDNRIKIDDADVSRHHCRVESDGANGWRLVDLDSRNGTFVNGARIKEPVPLATTDKITVGKFTLRILTENKGAARTVAPPSPLAMGVLNPEDGSFTDSDGGENDPLEKTRRFIKDRLLRLNLATQAVASDRDLERLLGAILDVVLDFTSFERALFLFVEEGELRPALARNVDHSRLAAEEQTFSRRVIHAALQRRDATIVRDSDKDIGGWDATASWETLGLKCAMCLPLEAPLLTPGAALTAESERRTGTRLDGTQRLLGVIYLDSKWDVRPFASQDRHLLRSVSAQAAIALQNARLYRLASQDSLTGLMTRFYFGQFLETELANARAARNPGALLMLDLDHFKAVNDQNGHQVGDRVLAEVARRLREQLRADDLVGRYGGEEFIVYLPGASLKGAQTVATKILEELRASPVLATPRVEMTVSIGVALFPEHGEETTLLVKRADQALFAAKHGGRNRIEVWKPGLDHPGRRTDSLAGIVSGNPARDQLNLRLLLEMIALCRRPTGRSDDLRILDLLRELMRSHRAALFAGDEPSRFELVSVRPELPAHDRARLRAIVAKAPVQDGTVCLAETEMTGSLSEMRAVMCVPLMDGERLFGALYVDSTAEKRAFTQDDIVLFEAVATQLAAALASDPRFGASRRK